MSYGAVRQPARAEHQAPIGEVYDRRLQRRARHDAAAAEHVDAPGRRPTTARRSRLYVNGAQPPRLPDRGSITTTTGPLRIGGNTIWGEYFSGLIDEVRVYNRALSAAEIQPGHEPRSARRYARRRARPGTCRDRLARARRSCQLERARRDNVGVAALRRLPLDDVRLHALGCQPDRPADRHELHRHRPARRHLLLQGARPRTRPATSSAASNEASAVVGDTTPPSAPGTLSASGRDRQGDPHAGARRPTTSASSRYNVHRVDDRRLHAQRRRTGSPSRRGTGYVDTTAARHLLLQGHSRGRGRQRRRRPRTRRATVVLADTTPAERARQPGAPRSPAARSTSAGRASTRRRRRRRGTTSTVGTSAGFTPSAANRIAQPTGTSYSDTGLATGTYYYKVHGRGRRRQPQPVLERGRRRPIADTTAPTRPSRPRRARRDGPPSTLTLDAPRPTTSACTRYNVHRAHDARASPRARQPDRAADRHELHRLGARSRHLLLQVTAEDAAGNVGARRTRRARRSADTTPPTAPTNLTATGGAGPGDAQLDAARPTTSVSRGTTSTARRARGSRPAPANRIAQPTRHELHRHGSRGRHLLLPRAPPRTRPATSARLATRPSATVTDGGADRPRRRLRLRRGQRHDGRRPLRQRQHRHAHRTPPGRRAASSATRSRSTARTPG